MGAEVKTRFASWRAADAVRSRALALFLVIALLTVAGCGEGPSNPTGLLGATITAVDGDQCAAPPEADLYAARVVDLVNEERLQNNLPPLSTNATLTRLAGDYACEMINGNYFEHVDPVTGSTVGSRALAANYYFKKVGENLAGGFTSPEETVAQWMDSPGHRANILDPDFIEMGAAIRTGGIYRWYWVQEFGLPR
jgi:uncharacterized protein YkwD